MRKTLGAITAGASYLIFTASAFADTIKIEPPSGSTSTIELKNIPQFIVTFLFLVGIVVAVAYLIYGGIKWVLSGGDKSAVESARNHIVAAIVGLVIVIAAFFILTTVVTLITGKPFDFNNICIPSLTNPTCGGTQQPTPTP